MPAVRKALVIGGGIGGLAAAVAMRRVGIAVDLVEIKSDWAVYGVGIIQPNNTLRALQRIGLAHACVASGASFPGWHIYNESEDLLMVAPGSNEALPACPAFVGITRPKLQKILTNAALEAGTHACLGVTVEAVDELTWGIRVSFSDGTSGDYELLVAADGIHSKTRTRLFGEMVVPRFSGQSVWRCNLPRPEEMIWGEVHYGAGTKVGLVPLSAKLMYMFLVTAEPGNPRMPSEKLDFLMRDRLGDYRGRLGALRESITDATAVVYKPMEAILLPPPWYKGRQIVIGDAAHATTPHLAQGAAMAIEDAVLLGELLGSHDVLSGALEEFMRRRFRRAKYVVDSSNQIATWELEQWNIVPNPNAKPGELLHEASLALMAPY